MPLGALLLRVPLLVRLLALLFRLGAAERFAFQRLAEEDRRFAFILTQE